MVDFVSSLGKNLLLCDVTTGQKYKRAPSDETFTPLHASTFPVFHPRSDVLAVRSLPSHPLVLQKGRQQLNSLF